MTHSNRVENIVIVGGGSAGWLTAGLLAAEFHNSSNHNFSVTLVESPEIKTLGVGEGTWPTMRETLRRIGVSENEFLVKCSASFKQASKFVNWRTENGNDSYYHPFMLPQGFSQTDVAGTWQSLSPDKGFARTVTPQPVICDLNLAPKQLATPEYAGVLNYGYHLDAGKFSEFLKDHCTNKLGVNYLSDHVDGVVSKTNDDIDALILRNFGKLQGDLFIDCSGFQALLIGKHYSVPLHHKRDILFNDSAWALQVPYENEDDPIVSHTVSTAQESGWIWDIGLSSRRGVGYTFSSQHTSDEAAVQVLEQYVSGQSHYSTIDLLNPRKIQFEPGYRATFWQNNCVAVGVSAGFIEPLEASALVMIEMAAAFIRDEMPANRDTMDIISSRFNEQFTYRWERVIDFLKLHYTQSQRRDSSYWRDHQNTDSIPDRLQDLLALWQNRPPSRIDFDYSYEVFPAASYQYVLFGMGGAFETPLVRNSYSRNLSQQQLNQVEIAKRKMLSGLPSNRALLNQLAKQ